MFNAVKFIIVFDVLRIILLQKFRYLTAKGGLALTRITCVFLDNIINRKDCKYCNNCGLGQQYDQLIVCYGY